MNYQTIIFIITALMISSCGQAPQSAGSKRIVSKDATGKGLKDTSEDSKENERIEKEKEEKKEKDEKEEDEDEQEEEIDKEDDEEAKTNKKQKEKKDEEEKAKESGKKLTAMTLTSNRLENDDLILKVKNKEGSWTSIAWPAKGASSKAESICGEKETVLEIQIEHPGKGTISAPSSNLGIIAKKKDSVELGYKVDGRCYGSGCQDDNVIVLSCPNGLSIKDM